MEADDLVDPVGARAGCGDEVPVPGLEDQAASREAEGLCGVFCGRGLRADYRQPEPDERPACIRDTRVMVSAVLGQLAAGRSIEEILVDYPYLDRDFLTVASVTGQPVKLVTHAAILEQEQDRQQAARLH